MPESLQDIIKRYNFASVATTQWQDPQASVLPYRGGGKYTVSPQAMSKAYTPVYRYTINPPKPPEPTDDEDSDDWNEDDDKDGKHEPSLLLQLMLILCLKNRSPHNLRR